MRMNFLRSILLLSFLTVFCPFALADYQIKSDDIRVDVSEFSGQLSENDTTVQKALETLDRITVPAETDPVFSSSEAHSINSTDTSNWDAAYGWGNHAGLYLPIDGEAASVNGLTITPGASISGNNTGDETSTSIKTTLGITTLSGSNTGDQDLSGLVPYNGATMDVSLGAYNISATDAKFSGYILSGVSGVDDNGAKVIISDADRKLGGAVQSTAFQVLGSAAGGVNRLAHFDNNQCDSRSEVTFSNSGTGAWQDNFVSFMVHGSTFDLGNFYLPDITGKTSDAGWSFLLGQGVNMAGLGILTYNSAPLAFGTNATTRMYISSTGYIGINNTNPTAQFDVNGLMRTTGFAPVPTTGTGLEMSYHAADELYPAYGQIYTFDRDLFEYKDLILGIDGNQLFLKNNGNILMGTTTDNTIDKFQVNGQSVLGGNTLVAPTGSATARQTWYGIPFAFEVQFNPTNNGDGSNYSYPMGFINTDGVGGNFVFTSFSAAVATAHAGMVQIENNKGGFSFSAANDIALKTNGWTSTPSIIAKHVSANNDKIGINTSAPDKVLEVNLGTSSAVRLTYNDSNGSAAKYNDFTVASTGALTLTNTANIFTYGNGVANTDITVNFTGTTNSGAFKWMEDEDYFQFSDDIKMTDNETIVLGGTGYVDSPSYKVGGVAGITASGTSCTITAITGGIITGATCS